MPAEKKDEISLKEIVVRFQQWYYYLRSKWILIIVTGLAGAGLGVFYAYKSKPVYTADLTFVLSSNSRSTGLMGLAGQFGIDVGGGNDDMFTGDNIVELFKSQRIIKGALFRLLPDSSQPLINLLIDKTEMRKGWDLNEDLKGLLPFPNDIKKLKPKQDSLVNEIHKSILKRYLTIDKIDKKLSFYIVSTTSPDEIISCYLTKYVVQEASQFYINTKTKTAQQNLQMLQHETDSLRNLLGSTIVSTAEETDKTFNLNTAYQVKRSPAQQGQINATVLGTAYGEVVKNLELAKITLAKDTPLYQTVDEPSLPLIKLKKGKLKWLIVGGFFGVFFVVCFFIGRYTYKTLML